MKFKLQFAQSKICGEHLSFYRRLVLSPFRTSVVHQSIHGGAAISSAYRAVLKLCHSVRYTKSQHSRPNEQCWMTHSHSASNRLLLKLDVGNVCWNIFVVRTVIIASMSVDRSIWQKHITHIRAVLAFETSRVAVSNMNISNWFDLQKRWPFRDFSCSPVDSMLPEQHSCDYNIPRAYYSYMGRAIDIFAEIIAFA